VTTASRLPPPPDPVWDLRPAPDPAGVEQLARELSLPPVFCTLLVARGLEDPDAAKTFLRPRLETLHPPEALPDALPAAERILRAIDAGETIFIHGDFDVDGVTATALLTRWLRTLGGKVVPFVPHRIKHGYDLGPGGVEAAREAGAQLLLTCDCGIRAHEAVRAAQALGMDVVVTDHHTPAETLPPALAVVNPARKDSTYPERELCGVAVAYKLCELLARLRGIQPEALYPYLALVALGTVADLMPLKGENRTLVRFGLRYLTHTPFPGLQALLAVAGVEGSVGARDISHGLAPRINAIGRMGDAQVALRLLLTEDSGEATRLAAELEAANQLRRVEDRRTQDEALELLSLDYDPERDLGVVVAGEGWHPGVIGIVATRVVERLHRPAVVVSFQGEAGRGSARSIPEVHLHQALEGCATHLTRFGGHRQAAGMDLQRADLEAFRARFREEVRGQIAGRLPPPRLVGELPLPLEAATSDFIRFQEHLAPFGLGNPVPLFWAEGVELAELPRTVGGEGAHLKVSLRTPSSRLEGIGFGLAHRRPPEAFQSRRADALFALEENVFRGRSTPQARLVDLRPRGES
jgi:single-stranded-DNA-specific exonuclease